ncbi:MAG: flavodoxin domain-containing protein [Anaerolineales bacterium]
MIFKGATSVAGKVSAGEEITRYGAQVEVLPLSQVKEIESYDGVVVGAAMIMGWHRTSLKFLKKHRDAFQRAPLAVFVMVMSLTQTGETSVDGVAVLFAMLIIQAPAGDRRNWLAIRSWAASLPMIKIIKAQVA